MGGHTYLPISQFSTMPPPSTSWAENTQVACSQLVHVCTHDVNTCESSPWMDAGRQVSPHGGRRARDGEDRPCEGPGTPNKHDQTLSSTLLGAGMQ
mmetsp:Transcript_71612/g.126071  ORF Transcript_71612/g.126071 Transcript_71612/m.126071 type:complete len:96 (-) Transcript_71612:40-327(-)